MALSPGPRRAVTAGALSLLCCSIGCELEPYEALKDESVGLGAVDPVTFPPANLGTAGNRMQPGSGGFVEVAAVVAGEAIGYFAYPVNTPAGRDPLIVLEDGKPYPGVSTPTAYAFDATDEQPVPDKNRCTRPPGHQPNARLDPTKTWFTQQGNIFTDLPKATYNPGMAAASTYVPVVAEARTSSRGRICQELKSEKRLSDLLGGKLPSRTGEYLAWLIIEPGAAVYTIDDPDMMGNGLGAQKWGWFNRYLLAYLDGGYIPVQEGMGGTMAMPTMTVVTRMVTQKLYFPRSPVLVGEMMTMTNVRIGQGYDVLTARRGQPGYSPLCEVFTYDAMTPLVAEMLPKDAQTIEMMLSPMPATPRYVYCLQVR